MKKYILSAGMPRSGSTLLFNMIREVLVWTGKEVASGWEGDPFDISGEGYLLVKTHDVTQDHCNWTDEVFFTYRDIRTALTSEYRMFGTVPTLKLVHERIRQYKNAHYRGAIMFQYEDLIRKKKHNLDEIIDVLGFKVDVTESRKIFSRILQILPPEPTEEKELSVSYHDPITLMHPGHFTATNDRDWCKVLPAWMQIELLHDTDFIDYCKDAGYPLE